MFRRSSAWLALLVTLASACSSFSGTEGETRDGGTDAIVDAAVPDMAPSIWATDVRVYPPAYTYEDGQFTYVVEDGEVTAVGDGETAPATPYCVLLGSGRAAGWATCSANEPFQDCIDREDAACPEYPATVGGRAMACSFEHIVDNHPTCAPMQYPRSLCADCGARTCTVYADGSHDCLAEGDAPSRPGVGACTHAGGGQKFYVGVTPAPGAESPPGTACAAGTDCFFTLNGIARCAEPAAPLPRYPLRGCDNAVESNAQNCHVARALGEVLPQYSEEAPTTTTQYCSARRENEAPSWTTSRWDIGGATCSSGQLCKLDGSDVGCATPEWSLDPEASELSSVCRDCLGVPCFVYEDGSYECTHTPTRALPTTGVHLSCCRKLPESDEFELGVSIAGSLANTFEQTNECPNAQSTCAFNADGIPACQ